MWFYPAYLTTTGVATAVRCLLGLAVSLAGPLAVSGATTFAVSLAGPLTVMAAPTGTTIGCGFWRNNAIIFLRGYVSIILNVLSCVIVSIASHIIHTTIPCVIGWLHWIVIQYRWNVSPILVIIWLKKIYNRI